MSVSPMTQPAHAGEVNSVIWRDGEKTSTVLPLGHIAAQIEEDEIGTHCEELRPAAQARRPDPRPCG